MSEKRQKKVRKRIITIVILILAVSLFADGMHRGKGQEAEENYLLTLFVQGMNRQLSDHFFLLPSFLSGESVRGEWTMLVMSEMEEEMPLYHYSLTHTEEENGEDEKLEELLRAQEGSDEDRKNITAENLDYDENALHIENNMIEEMQKENDRFTNKDKTQEDEETEAEKTEEAETETEVVSEEAGFQKASYPAYTYDWSEDWNYDKLVSNFYAVDNSTSLSEEYVALENLLYRDLSIEKKTGEGDGEDAPQILIYHTHSQEAFADSVPGDPSTTIVGAGEKLAQLLREEYGFSVMHHTGEYDVENRDYAYSNSLPAIEQLLKENPSIEVVIDLHRDAIKEGEKLVMDLQGRPTARFMFFNGMSYIRDKGEISYLENPYLQDNLALSFQAQVVANEYYPGIARRIYLKAYRYNLHLCPKSMLIELGAQTNTVEEIMNACDPLAHIIAIVLDENL